MSAIFWGSSRSTLPGPVGSQEPWGDALRTALHVGEYAILAALTYRALRKHEILRLRNTAQDDGPPPICHAERSEASSGTKNQILGLPTMAQHDRAGLLMFALTLLYALTDEWHQTFVPGRQFDLRDLALDAAGSALALLAISSASQSRTAHSLAQRIATRVERRDG